MYPIRAVLSARGNTLELAPADLLCNSLTRQCTSGQLKGVGISKDSEWDFSSCFLVFFFFEVTNNIIHCFFISPVTSGYQRDKCC